MPEPSPAPTPNRAIYGFVIYLLFTTIFIMFVLWAFTPTPVLLYLGLTYLPDKYFALYIPILVLTATTLFAFFIYPSLSLTMTPDIDEERTIRDRYTIVRCQHENCHRKLQRPFVDGWDRAVFCEEHEQSENCPPRQERIVDFCDCSTEMCLLKRDPSHIEKLRAKKMVPAVSDLCITDVSRILYRNK
jgi:phosphatidylinositol glycan class P protein